MKVFLRIGDDYLEDSVPCFSKAAAIDRFRDVAEELARFGQEIEASLHYARSPEELAEYPDCVLSLGPRGGVRCERC